MDPERWRRANRIFQDALEIPDERRDAWVEQACGDDTGTLREVRSLLEADAASGEFLEQPVIRHGLSRLDADSREPGRTIGHYRLLRKIGEGGMSEVYLAVRADDEFRKHVALKLVREDVGREGLLQRFRTERQILAGLDHHNIAKLLDGGTTDDGLPYFVMDYIDGVSIDDYCDRNRLKVDERLALFRTVCSAVQYAHQSLIVHRDLKASNILVTAEGVPKLLDFGIAKLLKPDQFAQAVEHTATWVRPMTPRYASPEQIQGKLIGTPSDVYSLGVLLYKLLTGHLPYHTEGKPPAELARLVVEEEPERPSAAITREETLPNRAGVDETITLESVSHARRTPAPQLERQLSGDLDNIVLMTLRKEPQRRYGSVEQLSEDLRRYLEGLPVIARKDTLGYRTTKFLRRNRLAVAAAAAFVALLIGFAFTMAVQAARIAQERDQARLERDRSARVVAFLQQIFEGSDPSQTRGETVTARELLDRGAERVEAELSGQPEVQAALMDSIGGVYRSLGLYDRAESLLRESLRRRQDVLDPDDPEILDNRIKLGIVLRLQGEYDEAERHLLEALELRRERLGEDDSRVAQSLHQLARLYQHMGRYEESERLYRQAVQVQNAARGEDIDLAQMVNDLGELLNEMGNADAAGARFSEALELRRRLLGNEHLLVADSLNNLGVYHGMQGNFAAAEPLFRESLEVRRKVLGPEHPLVGESLNNVGRLLKEQGRYDEAEALYREGLEIFIKRLGREHPRTAIQMHNLSRVLQAKGDLADAERVSRETLAIRRKILGPDHPELAFSLVHVGDVLVLRNDPAAAEPLLREGLAIYTATLPESHWRIPFTRSILGGCLAVQGRFEEAEPHLISGYEGQLATRGERYSGTRAALGRLVDLYRAWGKPEREATYRALAVD
jgi:serine/threonine-protein kinase